MSKSTQDPKAFKALSLALKGEVEAQYHLAMILEEELFIELAHGWYGKAAMQGHAEAAFRCGMLCLREQGEWAAQAPYWLERAANLGHTAAQYNLALVLEKGLGGRIDPEESLKWHRIAARAGHSASQARLDTMSSLFS